MSAQKQDVKDQDAGRHDVEGRKHEEHYVEGQEFVSENPEKRKHGNEEGVHAEVTELPAPMRCPNCETIVPEHARFCPYCGQDAHHTRLPFKHFVMEFIEDLFHFDTKVWLTMKRLLRNPGLVVKDFNDNKRARYVPPIKLYVFVSVLFFFVAGNNVGVDFGEIDTLLTKDTVSNTYELQSIKRLVIDSSTMHALRGIPNISERQVDSILKSGGIKAPSLSVFLLEQILHAERREISIDEIGTTFVGAINKILFGLMPLFALMVWMFVGPRRLYFTETLVYSIYVHSFFFLLLIIVELMNNLVEAPFLLPAAYIAACIYTVPSIRVSFGLTWPRSFAVSVALLTSYSTIVALVLSIALVGSFLV